MQGHKISRCSNLDRNSVLQRRPSGRASRKGYLMKTALVISLAALASTAPVGHAYSGNDYRLQTVSSDQARMSLLDILDSARMHSKGTVVSIKPDRRDEAHAYRVEFLTSERKEIVFIDGTNGAVLDKSYRRYLSRSLRARHRNMRMAVQNARIGLMQTIAIAENRGNGVATAAWIPEAQRPTKAILTVVSRGGDETLSVYLDGSDQMR